MESSSSSSSSSKRAKAPGNMMSTQVGHCLVDGCNADLRVCRDYHRRHKVCEVHSKTPKVTIGGREQRFCQQCSRFHSLVEFDEGKRSCRKRLDGHNRRRRKPQPDSLSQNSGLVFSSPPQAAALLSFSSPQVLPLPSVLGSAWTGLVKPETDMMLYNNNNNNYQQQQMNSYIHRQNSFQECSSQTYKCVNQLLDPHAAAASGSSNNGRKIFSDQERALSLLSPPPPSTTTREFGLNHPESVPLVHNYSYCGLGHQYPSAQESKEVVSSTGSHSTDPSSALHIPEMYQPGPDGSSTSGSHQTLTFMWE